MPQFNIKTKTKGFFKWKRTVHQIICKRICSVRETNHMTVVRYSRDVVFESDNLYEVKRVLSELQETESDRLTHMTKDFGTQFPHPE